MRNTRLWKVIQARGFHENEYQLIYCDGCADALVGKILDLYLHASVQTKSVPVTNANEFAEYKSAQKRN